MAFLWVLRLHAALLHLYPREFRAEFGEEIQGVFAGMLAEARQRKNWILLGVILREFGELPVNALDERLGSLRRSGMMLQSLRSLARPVWRIVRNAALIDVVILLLISVVGRAANWKTSDISFVLFFGGVFILVMAGFAASRSHHAPGVFGWGFSRYFTQGTSLPLQLLQKYVPMEVSGGATSGLADLLQIYAGSISIAIAGLSSILIGAGMMD